MILKELLLLLVQPKREVAETQSFVAFYFDLIEGNE